MNKITTLSDIYEEDRIESVDALLVESMTGSGLEYDTLKAVVRAEIDPKQYKFGRPVYYYHDGKRIGKFFMQKCIRVKKDAYSISCMSAIGLLGKSKHYGGVYFSGEDTFATVVADILGGIVPYTIDATIANQKVFGWLPVATRRENLHQLLFAMGATIKKDIDGDMYFTVLSRTITKNVPDSRIYIGGSVTYPDQVSKVSVLEHAYIMKTTEEERETLYDGIVELPDLSFKSPKGQTLRGMLVEFTEPMHTLSIEGGEILESGANYAIIVSFEENAVLTGYRYTHTTVERFKGDEFAEEDNTVTVKDATLVSRANSNNVVDRLYSFYTSAKTIKMDIVVEDERAGDAVSFRDPFDEDTVGIISELYLVGSNVLKGSAEIVADFAPTWGNDYTDVIVVSKSEKVELPIYAKKVRAVLIGGGHGGARGGTGGNGEVADGKYRRGGAGGAGGLGGNGGKVSEPVIAEYGDGLIVDCKIGTGGAGGTAENPSGESGTASTITYRKDGEEVVVSSDSGYPSYSGFQDFLHPLNVYGARGADGVKGADGGGSNGNAGNVTHEEVIYIGGGKISDKTENCNDGFDAIYKQPYVYKTPDTSGVAGLEHVYNPELLITVSPVGIELDDFDEPVFTGVSITVDKALGMYRGQLLFYVDRHKTWSLDLSGIKPETFSTADYTHSTIYEIRVKERLYADSDWGEDTAPYTILCRIDARDFYNANLTYRYGYGSGATVAVNGINGTEMVGANGVDSDINGEDAVVLGSGGNGGNGGSGGGAGGFVENSANESFINYAGGVGGKGSNGGAGADGVILIYHGRTETTSFPSSEETIYIDRTAYPFVVKTLSLIEADRAVQTETEANADALPAQRVPIQRTVTTATEEGVAYAGTKLMEAEETVKLKAKRGLHGYLRAGLYHVVEHVLSVGAGLVKSVARTLRHRVNTKLILTAAAWAYNAIAFVWNAVIKEKTTAGAVSAEAAMTTAEKDVVLDKSAEANLADGAVMNSVEVIGFESAAKISLNSYLQAAREILTDVSVGINAAIFIPPKQDGTNVHIVNVYEAQQNGTILYIGKSVDEEGGET